MNENEIREYALMKATFKWLLIGMLFINDDIDLAT